MEADKKIINLWKNANDHARAELADALSEAEKSFIEVVAREEDRMRMRLRRIASELEVSEDFIITSSVSNLSKIEAIEGIVRNGGRSLLEKLSGARKIGRGGRVEYEFVSPRSWARMRLSRMEDLAFSHTQRNARNLEKFYRGALAETDRIEKKLKSRIASSSGRAKTLAEDRLRFLLEDKAQLRERMKKNAVSRRLWEEGAAARNRRAAKAYREIFENVQNMTRRAMDQISEINFRIVRGETNVQQMLKRFDKVNFPSDSARHRTWMRLKGHYENERHEIELAGRTEDERRSTYYIHRGPFDSRTTEVSRDYLGRIKTRAEWEQVAASDPRVPGAPAEVWIYGLYWGERGHFDMIPDEMIEQFGKRRLSRAA